MAVAARDDLVMERLRESGSASVAELATTLGITESTVRRTLQRLAEDGRVIRTYGGAAVVEGGTVQRARDEDPHIAYKRVIGASAAALVDDGSTIALSSGSTVLEMARHLRDRHLTVITNALDVANALLDADGIELVVLGGVVLPGIHSMRGHMAVESLRDLRADTVYMGASAIDLDNGFMTEQVREISVDRAMRMIARDAVVLADASKFDHMAPGFMFGFEQVGTVVTDARIERETRLALESSGVRVVTGGAHA